MNIVTTIKSDINTCNNLVKASDDKVKEKQ